jgi:predicted DNA-binding antitoxin AbrB/MazE fold protein
MGLGAVVLSGCLRATVQPESSHSPSEVPVATPGPAETSTRRVDLSPPKPPTDYPVSQAPPVKPEAAPAPPPVEPVDLRIKPEVPPPAKPAELPQPQMQIQPAPPPKPDAVPVQALRSLLERRRDEEIREQVKRYDPLTQEALLVLLGSVAQLEHTGGVEQTAPRDVAALVDRLNAIIVTLRARAQLTLDNLCFCSRIENFGKFSPLENVCFQPGEEVHVYVQVRNFATRQTAGRYETILKGKLEFYDERERAKPFLVWNDKPQCDCGRTPRHDYFVNFRFSIPQNLPPGSYTLWITVEDWTDAPSGAKEVPPSRFARSSLDFRVGPPSRHPRTNIAEVTPAR